MESKATVQLESCCLGISMDTYLQLFAIKGIHEILFPGIVKKHQQVKGQVRAVGSVERFDFCDGTHSELEMVRLQVSELKVKSCKKVKTTTMVAMPENGEIVDTWTVRPVTFSACPFKQGIWGLEAKDAGRQPTAPQIIFEWKTAANFTMSDKDLETIKTSKLNFMAALSKDIMGHLEFFKARHFPLQQKDYLAAKQERSEKPGA